MLVLDLTHDSKGCQVVLPTNKLNKISVTDSEDHKTYEITLLQNNEPFKYLGMTFSTDDDQNTLISNNDFGNDRRIKNILFISPFIKYHVTLYLFTRLNPKIHCTLSYTPLFHKEYDSLYKAHIPNTISSLGYNRTWPSALRFGWHKYSCLQLTNMQREVTIRKNGIISLLQKKETAKAVHILIAWYQHASESHT